MRCNLLFTKESTTETKSSDFSAPQRKIVKELDNMETSWSAKQRESYKDKLAALFTKNENRHQFVYILLHTCKEHNGPVTNEKELMNLVESAKDKKSLKSSLRGEIQYQKAIHTKDAQERPDLYKVNSLT